MHQKSGQIMHFFYIPVKHSAKTETGNFYGKRKYEDVYWYGIGNYYKEQNRSL